LLGDSVALSFGFDLGQLAPAYGFQYADSAMIGCGIEGSEVGLRNDKGEIGPPPGECTTWEQYWLQQVKEFRPHIAVILVGRWECLDVYWRGHWAHLREPDFDAYMLGQLVEAIRVAGGEGAKVVVMTMPYIWQGTQADGRPWPQTDPARIARFNSLVRQAAERVPGTVVLDLQARIEPQGRFVASIGGEPLFTSDGVHFVPKTVLDELGGWFFGRLRQIYLSSLRSASSFVDLPGGRR
jgi:hypothetical protein